MSSALHCYLVQLVEERHATCENLTIESDNAHSKLRTEDCLAFQECVGNASASSGSARWTESSSSSDSSLRVPWRSQDLPIVNESCHDESVDSAERWLRELPLDEGRRAWVKESSQNRREAESHDDDCDVLHESGPNMAPVNHCSCGMDEIYPAASLQKLDPQVGVQSRSSGMSGVSGNLRKVSDSS